MGALLSGHVAHWEKDARKGQCALSLGLVRVHVSFTCLLARYTSVMRILPRFGHFGFGHVNLAGCSTTVNWMQRHTLAMAAIEVSRGSFKG